MSGHGLGWEDDGTVYVDWCPEGGRLGEDGFTLHDARWADNAGDVEVKVCPKCGKSLRLVWDVRVVEVIL